MPSPASYNHNLFSLVEGTGMWRLLLVFGLFLAHIAPAAAQGASPSARVTQVDSTKYPEVTLSVSVTDAVGTPVSGLQARDFKITEDGVPVDLTAFAGGGGPIAAALVIDRSGSMAERGKLAGAQQAAQTFVRQLRSNDQAALLAFDDRPELIENFTSDQAQLNGAIGRISANGSTALYDSIIAGVSALSHAQGRRALVVLTDGRDRMSVEDSTPASQHSLAEAIQTARDAGISAQVIGLGDRASDDLMDGIDEPVLEQIANETGGQYFYAPDATALAKLYASLATTMQQEYQLSYRSPRPAFDGTRRDIQVAVVGGATTSGGYVEPHMIQVRSNPWVALALLLPLLGLLFAPRFIRGGKNKVVDIQPEAPVEAEETLVTVALAPSFCDQCGAGLRPGARFCAGCGSRVVVPPSGEVQR